MKPAVSHFHSNITFSLEPETAMSDLDLTIVVVVRNLLGKFLELAPQSWGLTTLGVNLFGLLSHKFTTLTGSHLATSLGLTTLNVDELTVIPFELFGKT